MEKPFEQPTSVSSIQMEIGAKGECKPTVKIYFEDNSQAHSIADQALGLCDHIIRTWAIKASKQEVKSE